MAKPRIFISSTYYDLRHIRQGLEQFIEELGFEAILFESGDIPFSHDRPLDESCYREISTCHILVLIIGGRFGSTSSDSIRTGTDDVLEKFYQHYNSITQKEYETAINQDIPTYVFIDKSVHAEYGTFKKNRNKQDITYAHVDSANIFKLIDSIYSLKRNNLTHEFEKLSDITSWLRDQWAGLFAEFLSKKTSERQLLAMTLQLARLESVSETLKDYSESIIRDMAPTKADEIIRDTEAKHRFRQIIEAISNEPLFSHLMDAHKIDANQLYDNISSSRTASEFQDTLKSLLEANNMQCFACEATDTIESANIIRKLLGKDIYDYNGLEITNNRPNPKSKSIPREHSKSKNISKVTKKP